MFNLGSMIAGVASAYLPQNLINNARNILSNPNFNSIYRTFTNSRVQTVTDSILGQGATGINPLADMERLPDPMLGFHWTVVLPFGMIPMYIENITVPFNHIDANPYHRGNSKRYDPGFVDVDGLSITFYEDVRGTILRYLNNWKKLIVDKGFYGLPHEYKQPIIITMHDYTGNPVVVFRALGCWPSTVNDLDLDGGTNEGLKVNVQFSVDDIEYEVVGSNEGFVTEGGVGISPGRGGEWWEPLARRAVSGVLGRFGISF